MWRGIFARAIAAAQALAGDTTTEGDELFQVASRVGELLDQAEVMRVKIRRELTRLLPTVAPASATRIGG